MYFPPFKLRTRVSLGASTSSLEGKEPRKKYRNRGVILGDHARIQLLTGKKTEYTMTLKPSKSGKVLSEKQIGDKNPDKISFGTIHKNNTRLEFCAYKTTLKPNPHTMNPLEKDLSKPLLKVNPKGFFLFINNEWISLDVDDWRKLFRISNRIGHYFGLLGRKKAK